MTYYTIEHVTIDFRFIIPTMAGKQTRKTIYKGVALNDDIAIYEAELICGKFEKPYFNKEEKGRKYRTWVRTHTLHDEHQYSSFLRAIFRTEF